MYRLKKVDMVQFRLSVISVILQRMKMKIPLVVVPTGGRSLFHRFLDCARDDSLGVLLRINIKNDFGDMEERKIIVQRYQAPCGRLVLGSFRERLCLCDWEVERHSKAVDRRLERMLKAEFEEGTTEIIREAAGQLDGYFRRERKSFDIPLLFAGTEFQKKVWKTLEEIPYGKTISYAGLAARLDMPGAVRAVANANGANAISIFLPCHRVIGNDGSLTGYGGGLAAKKFLLELESDSLF